MHARMAHAPWCHFVQIVQTLVCSRVHSRQSLDMSKQRSPGVKWSLGLLILHKLETKKAGRSALPGHRRIRRP